MVGCDSLTGGDLGTGVVRGPKRCCPAGTEEPESRTSLTAMTFSNPVRPGAFPFHSDSPIRGLYLLPDRGQATDNRSETQSR